MPSTASHKYRSFGLRCLLNISLAVLVEEVQILLEVLGVLVVSGGEFILQVHLNISMLGAALPQENVEKVVLLGVLTCD